MNPTDCFLDSLKISVKSKLENIEEKKSVLSQFTRAKNDIISPNTKNIKFSIL